MIYIRCVGERDQDRPIARTLPKMGTETTRYIGSAAGNNSRRMVAEQQRTVNTKQKNYG